MRPSVRSNVLTVCQRSDNGGVMEADLMRKILESSSLDDVITSVHRLTEALGFQTYSVIQAQDGPGGVRFTTHHNAPAEFVAVEDPVAATIDPVMQHAKKHSLPLIWDRQTYIGANRDDLWREQAEYGYRSGIIVAMHMPRGKHLALGLDMDADRVGSASEVTHKAALLQLAATHVQCALDRIARDAAMASIKLAPRELECLRWTMEGKTAWETSVILGISERTVNQYLGRATEALGAANKNMAVIKAVQLGLLD